MRSALLYGRRDLRLADMPMPVPGPGELLVQVHACGICPGDVRSWILGTHSQKALPVNLGHEATGVVVDAGSAEGRAHVGRRVVADGLGGYADFKVISKWSLDRSQGPPELPDELSFVTGVFVEPLADCLYAVEQCAQIHEARTAIVVGCGQMGLQLVRLCVLAGARVLACDPDPRRRALAEAFGAERTLASCTDGFSDAVADLTAGRGADCALLACAAPAVASPTLAVLADGGRCVFFSAYEDDRSSQLDLDLVHRKRLHLVGSRWIARAKEPLFQLYDRAAQLLARRLVNVESLIEATVGLDELQDAFSAMRAGAMLKAVVVI